MSIAEYIDEITKEYKLFIAKLRKIQKTQKKLARLRVKRKIYDPRHGDIVVDPKGSIHIIIVEIGKCPCAYTENGIMVSGDKEHSLYVDYYKGYYAVVGNIFDNSGN